MKVENTGGSNTNRYCKKSDTKTQEFAQKFLCDKVNSANCQNRADPARAVKG